MRLTNFTDYTLRVLIYLGAHRRKGRLATIGDIAAVYGISDNHLMKIVYHLAKQGYVVTTRGKGGGMRLARAPELINIGDVVRGAEEDLAVVECFRPGSSECSIAPACALRGILGRALSAFFEVLDGETLADLLVPRAQLVSIFRVAGARRKRLPRTRIAATGSD
jgi:Rrf2 family nitric oxide-sensitive transcriptional repressor